MILQVHGEKGGAKSMLETLIKELVDPAKPKLLSTHKDRMEFIQQLAHNYLAYYDNLKYIPGWLSDEVCRAVTDQEVANANCIQTTMILSTNTGVALDSMA